MNRPITTLARVAARYAHLWDVTVSDAAREFRLQRSTVAAAWRQIYPGRSARLSKRERPLFGRAICVVTHAEDEVTL